MDICSVSSCCPYHYSNPFYAPDSFLTQDEQMATISACTPTSSIPRAALFQKASAARPSAVVGLPSMKKGGRVSCSAGGGKAQESEAKVGMTAATSAMAAAAMWSPAAMALVDERMSTEGTGLPIGVSNNLLIWIIVGVFALIWALYIIYASGLEEDEESGLSL